MDNNIKNLRKQIMTIDKKIIKLLKNRICLSNKIGMIKNQRGLKIKDLEQEKRILAQTKNTPHDPIPTKDLIKIFTSIIKICRQSQKKLKKYHSIQKDGEKNDYCNEK
ncbi:MAG: chorismate mutase [bacterium]